MTEKEFIINMLNRLNLEIYYEEINYVEFENTCGYESMVVEFDDVGNITSIGC